jgi:glycosyltransferase involved in cell wall biosynthesis
MFRFSICTSFFRDVISDATALYDSICAQDADWEWVVTDDFSEDGTVREWLQELSLLDTRVRYVEQQSKMQMLYSPGSFATGELVIQIDSDDYFYPGYLPLLDSLFTRFPEVGVVICAGQVKDQHENYIRYQMHSSEDMSSGGLVCYLGRCWRRELDPNFDGILEEGFQTFCHDLFIVGHISARAGMLVLPRPFVRYREHRGENGYEPFGARGGADSERHAAAARSYEQFISYYSTMKKRADGLFTRYEPVVDLATMMIPSLDLLCGKVRMVGFTEPEWRKILIEELYSEQKFSWGDTPEEGSLNVYHHQWMGEVSKSAALCCLPHIYTPNGTRGVLADSWIERLGTSLITWQGEWCWLTKHSQ